MARPSTKPAKKPSMAAFIRKHLDLSPADIVELAAKEGLKISEPYASTQKSKALSGGSNKVPDELSEAMKSMESDFNTMIDDLGVKCAEALFAKLKRERNISRLPSKV